MTEYKTDTGMIYAVRQQPEGGWRIMCRYPGAGWAMTTDPRLSAECSCAESLQEVLDAYAQRKGWAVYDPPEASPISPAAATAAAEEPASPPAEPAPANTTAEPAAGGSEPEERALAANPATSDLSQPAAFDFSALGDLAEQAAEADAQFNAHYGRAQDEYLISCIYMARIHSLTARAGRYGGGTWTAWYKSKGISEGSARTMVQNGEGFKSATVADLKLLPAMTQKDINLIAREGKAPELLAVADDSARVKDLLAQLKAKSDELAAEKSRADSLSAEIGAREEKISELLEASEQADQRANQAETRIKGLEDSYRSAHANEEFAIRRAADAESRAARAEQKAAELEARPIEVAVQQPSDADLTRWRAEGAEQARREAAASIASADAARQKAEDRIKKLQETLQGRTDHLNAVEAELAQLKAQLKTAPSSKPAPGCAPACIPCTECAYEDSCCGLSFLGDIPEEDDAINARLTGCTAGKRKGRPA